MVRKGLSDERLWNKHLSWKKSVIWGPRVGIPGTGNSRWKGFKAKSQQCVLKDEPVCTTAGQRGRWWVPWGSRHASCVVWWHSKCVFILSPQEEWSAKKRYSVIYILKRSFWLLRMDSKWWDQWGSSCKWWVVACAREVVMGLYKVVNI